VKISAGEIWIVYLSLVQLKFLPLSLVSFVSCPIHLTKNCIIRKSSSSFLSPIHNTSTSLTSSIISIYSESCLQNLTERKTSTNKENFARARNENVFWRSFCLHFELWVFCRNRNLMTAIDWKKVTRIVSMCRCLSALYNVRDARARIFLRNAELAA
jgi:hypothetical protein